MSAITAVTAEQHGLASLSTQDLTARIVDALRRERGCATEFIWLLAEIDQRRSYCELGYDSLFTYCTSALKLSNGCAFRRTWAARLFRRFPSSARLIADGSLNLTTLVLLKDVLQPDNYEDIFKRAAGLTEEEVKKLVAELQPRPDLPESLRRVPQRSPSVPAPTLPNAPEPPHTSSPEVAPTPLVLSSASVRTESTSSPSGTAPARESSSTPVAPAPPSRPEPLRPGRYALRLTVGESFVDDLRRVRSELSHVLPTATNEDLLGECLRIALDVLARRKRGSPVRTSSTSKTRNRTKARAPSRQPVGTARTSGLELSSSTTAGSPRTSGLELHSSTSASSARTSGLELSSSTSATSARTSGLELHSSTGTSSARTSGLDLDSSATAGSATSSGREVGTSRGHTRYISAAVKRAVWDRDGGRCAFVSGDGTRCNSTRQLEFHHLHAFALGGESTASNLAVYCRAHNRHAAVEDFGEQHMSLFSSRPSCHSNHDGSESTP